MAKNDTKKTNKVVEASSDDEVETKQPVKTQKSTKTTTKEVVKETKKSSTKPSSKQSTKVKDVTNKDSDDDSDDSDSEDELVQNDDSDEEPDQEAGSESDESEEDEEEKPKEKEKKPKESFEEVVKRFDELVTKMKSVNKKLAENEAEHKVLQREGNDAIRELTKLSPLLTKSHIDKMTLVRKEKKSNRKGKSNSGIMAPKPIPEVFRKFLSLPEDTLLTLPQLMSRFSTKLATTGQKEGQTAILNQSTLKALGISHDEPKRIKFTEMMHFIASFYPKKETTKVEVEV